MASGPMTAVLRHLLHRLVTPHGDEEAADRHLLDRFLVCRDEAALSARGRRYAS